MTETRELRTRRLMHGHCRHCGHAMVFQPKAGWVVLHPGDTYDICPANDYLRHEPDLYADEERGTEGRRRSGRD